MAGNYANVPSWRFALDRDGTQWFWIWPSNVISAADSTEVAALCDESDSIVSTSLGGNQSRSLLIIFPELRDIDGYFVTANCESGASFQTSVNSTNGIDGTWVTQWSGGSFSQAGTVPSYRTSIQSSTLLAVKAVRINLGFGYGQWIRAVHLYGEISPAQNPNRLVLWHPTLDQRVTPSYFDWGDVPRSSSADKQFRVKNLSASLTANSIRVAQDVLTDTTPSVPGQHTLSTDAVTFLAQVNVGVLLPGAISGVVTLRRVTPTNATLSLWAHRVFAEANTWS